jgi:hypothetical protein
LGFSQVATARCALVCAAWKAVHDALVTRLVLTRQTTDEAMGMLVLRFPAVASLELNDTQRRCWTDEGMRAVSSCTALTLLNLAELFRLQGKYEEALQVRAAYQRFRLMRVGLARGDRERPLNDAQRPHSRIVRVALDTGFNRVRGLGGCGETAA